MKLVKYMTLGEEKRWANSFAGLGYLIKSEFLVKEQLIIMRRGEKSDDHVDLL